MKHLPSQVETDAHFDSLTFVTLDELKTFALGQDLKLSNTGWGMRALSSHGIVYPMNPQGLHSSIDRGAQDKLSTRPKIYYPDDIKNSAVDLYFYTRQRDPNRGISGLLETAQSALYPDPRRVTRDPLLNDFYEKLIASARIETTSLERFSRIPDLPVVLKLGIRH